MPRTALDPLFTTTDAPGGFTERHLAHLIAATSAAVTIPRFLTEQTCADALAALDRLPTAAYDLDRVPTPIVRFGPSLNDYRTAAGGLDADRYWRDAEAARVSWQRARLRPDPVALSLARLGTAWGSAISPATIGGRPVFAGTLREINEGTLLHYDDVRREFPCRLFDQETVAQLAFNVWAAVPETGGSTTLWRHRWDPADEQHRYSYGYRPKAVEHCQQVSLRPQLGGALLFNPAHFHEVQANPGQRRIALAFFLALTTTGQLITWS